jgi:4-hydroxybenzoate polyprenyltransferase
MLDSGAPRPAAAPIDIRSAAAAGLPAAPAPAPGGYREALLLMRIPFSLFLMPVYWFALSTVAGGAQAFPIAKAVVVFVVLHLLVYPASNGYNSWWDRDEGSIGGLERPPQVTPKLWHLIVIFDVLSLALSLFLGWRFALMVALYVLVSKAYSHGRIRLKAQPWVSTIVVTFFQGFFTYIMVQQGLQGGPLSHTAINLQLATVATLFLLGSYPLTQIYQHAEDAARGDRTLSLVLGLRGTFAWAGAAFFVATGLLCYTYFTQFNFAGILIYLAATAPILGLFVRWMLAVLRHPAEASYKRTMRMSATSSLCLSAAFIAIMIYQLVAL